MFTKEVSYTDIFTGEPKKKVLYFHLTQKELMDFATRMQVDNLKEYIDLVQQNQDRREMYRMFNALVLASYGERTNTGAFIKKDAEGRPYSIEFESSEAYSNFMMEIFDDETGGLVNTFIEKVIPVEVMEKAEAEMARRAKASPDSSK